MTYISISAFRDLYSGSIEFAVIDPRERLFFTRGHLFAASNMPLSRLELLIETGVPDKGTLIVLCDDGEGRAGNAAGTLAELGYMNTRILQGGLPAWALMGGAVFSGVNVPSKAFGEVVERDLETPSLTAKQLGEKLDRGEDILLLDARPIDEHEQYCIPGSISCPSAEMILRIAEMEQFHDKDVVVHCAGRTRSILGAQTLIDSGLFKSVKSLCNGTPGWEFEGLITEKGNSREAELPVYTSKAARASAKAIQTSWNIPTLDATDFEFWRQSSGTRYVFDIRSAQEFASGHLASSRHIAGGQLLQSTDQHIVVQNSHIALVDTDGVRAVTTAMWLRRMGWRNVVTYTMSDAERQLEACQTADHQVSDDLHISIEDALAAHQSTSAQFCDLRWCYEYRRGHVAGAAYLSRAELEVDVQKLPPGRPLILVVDDIAYGALVLQDLTKLGCTAKILRGGMDAWAKAGNPVETGARCMLSRPTDTYFESDHFEDFQIHLREHHAYLNWEIALIDHIVGDPAVRFDTQ